MLISPIDRATLSSNLAQFKGQALSALFDRATPAWNAGGGRPLLDPRLAPAAADALTSSAGFGGLLDQFSATLRLNELPTSTTPTGLDAAQPFSQPGQNMVTVLNRVEVTFKAQFSELGQLGDTLVEEGGAAQKLSALDANSSSADIKTALDNFVKSYNAGVERFAPALAKGGVLEGSWEAARARFATERDINFILNGAKAGLKGGLAALGISADQTTGLAAIDPAQLDAALARDKGVVVSALGDFATSFVATVASLNAPDHAQVRQMANLDRAVHWIDANKGAVQKEFGPGAAATPNAAFAKAAAQYDSVAHLIGGG